MSNGTNHLRMSNPEQRSGVFESLAATRNNQIERAVWGIGAAVERMYPRAKQEIITGQGYGTYMTDPALIAAQPAERDFTTTQQQADLAHAGTMQTEARTAAAAIHDGAMSAAPQGHDAVYPRSQW